MSGSGKKGRSKKKGRSAPYDEGNIAVPVIGVALAVLFFLSNIGLLSVVGTFLNGLLTGLFGLTGYLLPFALAAFTVLVYIFRYSEGKVLLTKYIGAPLTLAFFCAFCQILRTSDYDAKIAYIYTDTESRAAGGVFGSLFVKLFYPLIGRFGCSLLFLLLIFAGIILLLYGRPLEALLTFIYEGRENLAQRRAERESYNEYDEYDNELYEENTANHTGGTFRGVTKDTDLSGDKKTLANRPWASQKSNSFEGTINGIDSGYRTVRASKATDASAKKGIYASGDANQNADYGYQDNLNIDDGISDIRLRHTTDAGLFLPHEKEEESRVDSDSSLTPEFGLQDTPLKASDNNEKITAERIRATSSELEKLDDLHGSKSGLSNPEFNRDDSLYINNETGEITGFDERFVFEDESEEEQEELSKYNENPYADADTDMDKDEDGHVYEDEYLSNDEYCDEDGYEEGDRSYSQPKKKKGKAYRAPFYNMLTQPKKSGTGSISELKETAQRLEKTLRDFGVGVKVTGYQRGPSVTRYEIQPDQGVKVSKILSYADDIKLSLAVADVRIEAPIPGKSAIGIEVPNTETSSVTLREVIESDKFRNHRSKIAFAVGKNIAGEVIIADLAKMPHLLIAGTTGSGKSVCVNGLIVSILYHAKPSEVGFIMIDPKMVELKVYEGIPHLLYPVVTDPKKAAAALNWAVQEMIRRYKVFADHNVRDIKGYNQKVTEERETGNDIGPKMKQIVVVVDELADLMMTSPKEVEEAIFRLAQMARAAGIHLVIVTQRPSVNVITGTIKANIPSRIALKVASGVDSRTIIDMNGAEKLLGWGDMLYYPNGAQKPVRVQGCYISDDEVNDITAMLSKMDPDDEYEQEEIVIAEAPSSDEADSGAAKASADADGRDELYAQVGRFVTQTGKPVSIGLLQRKFRIGFNRAARIVDSLADDGVLSADNGDKKAREVLMTSDEFEMILVRYK